MNFSKKTDKNGGNSICGGKKVRGSAVMGNGRGWWELGWSRRVLKQI